MTKTSTHGYLGLLCHFVIWCKCHRFVSSDLQALSNQSWMFCLFLQEMKPSLKSMTLPSFASEVEDLLWLHSVGEWIEPKTCCSAGLFEIWHFLQRRGEKMCTPGVFHPQRAIMKHLCWTRVCVCFCVCMSVFVITKHTMPHVGPLILITLLVVSFLDDVCNKFLNTAALLWVFLWLFLMGLLWFFCSVISVLLSCF